MSYSLYFRRKVLCIKQKERLSYEESGKRFGIGKQTVYRWTKRLDPKLVHYKPPSKIDMERLKKDVGFRRNKHLSAKHLLFFVLLSSK